MDKFINILNNQDLRQVFHVRENWPRFGGIFLLFGKNGYMCGFVMWKAGTISMSLSKPISTYIEMLHSLGSWAFGLCSVGVIAQIFGE